MKIGPGIALLVIGAILVFAVSDQSIGPVDLQVVGFIMLGAGALALLLGLVLMASQRNPTSSTTRRTVDDGRNPPREETTRRDYT